jgi:hypothetical protein
MHKLSITIILALLVNAINTAFAQVQPVIELNSYDIVKNPYSIHFIGKVKDAYTWKDKNGEHLVVLSETGNYFNEKFKHENDGGDAELLAAHFNVEQGIAQQSWKIYDFISDCPIDYSARFIPDAFRVTDLNDDGTSEVWVMYEKFCKGDQSPNDMKLIMYSGAQKYALRGTTKISIGEDDTGEEHYDGGDYKIDPAFDLAPSEFLTYAKKMWIENMYRN